MADVIQLLPDNIANQIAAGEVIQRPASVVKELLENSIDAGSSQIKLILKDSGKTLIQVIDDGVGMSDTDARLCFERHATSKIKSAEDLFKIDTKGFRGEALASIAAIAHVELLTRQPHADVGCRIVVAGSKVEKTEAVQTHQGTSFSVKNLFYNIPARRKFLKSDPVELKHIIEEFYRVAIIHCDITFTLHHNGNDLYYLPKSGLKQRIVSIFGKTYNEKLLQVNEQTELISIEGFIAKAEAAKKSPGDQYLFVNNRFVKNNYLNHAVKNSFDNLLLKDQYPGFYINLTIDPSKLDINVSPTKTEVKFDDERLVYNYLRVAVKHALGVFVVAPTIDFDTDTNFGASHSQTKNIAKGGYQKYSDEVSSLERENLKSWKSVYEGLQNGDRLQNEDVVTFKSQISIEKPDLFPQTDVALTNKKEPYQIHNRYIVSQIKSGFVLIDQQNAHERIVYEENLSAIKDQSRPVQKELFPQMVEFDANRAHITLELLPYFNKMGFEIESFGNNSFIVHGLPMGLPGGTNATRLIENLVGQYSENLELQLGIVENLSRSYAVSSCVKRGTVLTVEDMKSIIDKLFACETPYISPTGHKCFIDFSLEDLKLKFA
ncbi:MAG: DNA mismatch repair endonuclease MutL [Saprospiraceae bacterium]|nr:DNA mismatch repair endonuclease MutL [Saprospiraceae bacterium]